MARTKNKPRGNRASEHVPAAPFSTWLNQRYAALTVHHRGNMRAATEALARECGWGDHADGGIRKLFKVRKQQYSGSVGGVKGEYPAAVFTRPLVEEALHHAGVPFSDVYPDIAAAEELALEPDAWCDGCDDLLTPIGGYCPFCELQIAPLTGRALLGSRRAA